MEKWAKMGKFKSYVNQDDIAREIVECHSSLSDCITKLQVGFFSDGRIISIAYTRKF